MMLDEAMKVNADAAGATGADADLAAWPSPQLPGTLAKGLTSKAEKGPATGNGRGTMNNDTTKNGGKKGDGDPAGSAASPFSHAAPEGHAKTMSAVLGEIVWLMSQSPLHKQFFISDLEWFVMTPALLQQFRLYYDQQKPIGVVLWASVSDEVAERLAQGTTKLRPQDWKSGDTLWVVEVIAPFGGAEEMVKDLKEKVFPEREIRFLAMTNGKQEIRVL